MPPPKGSTWKWRKCKGSHAPYRGEELFVPKDLNTQRECRAECPQCQRYIAIDSHGYFRAHAPTPRKAPKRKRSQVA